MVGHSGRDRLEDLLRRDYYISGLQGLVKEVLEKCDVCKKAKDDRTKPKGVVQPLKVLEGLWEGVAFDLITKLPKSRELATKRSWDSIWVVADYLTKYAYFVPASETGTAEELAYMFLKIVVANYRVSKYIISDRAKVYTSNFWKAVASRIGIKLRPSTAYHSQTDRMIERLNQTLETYLRMYVNDAKSNWAELLPLAQFAYNQGKHASTGESPFYMNYARHPRVLETQGRSSSSLEADQRTDQWKASWERAKEAIKKSQERMRKAQHKKRAPNPTWEVGQKVYLATNKALGKRTKLDPRKEGPYLIKKKISDVVYKLDLPGKRHDNFHVSRLSIATDETPLATNQPLDLEESCEVEKILDQRQIGRRRELLVKWKNQPATENSWERITNLRDAGEAIRLYQAKTR
jgi:hypothetical protein